MSISPGYRRSSSSHGAHSAPALLHGFKTAVIVSVVAASISVAAVLLRRLLARSAAPVIECECEPAS
jgi:hypothetical protein